jgi:3-oxoacyl-[acyl-carrier-protein] synthase II
MARHAVITGLGIIAPIGMGKDAFWKAALEGRSGTGPLTLCDPGNLPAECRTVGEVRDFSPAPWMSPVSARTAGRFTQFAVAASRMAIEDSGLDLKAVPSDRIGIVLGTSMSGLTDVHETSFSAFLRGDKVPPWTVLEYPAQSATSQISITLGSTGEAMSVATACAAGLDAVGLAAEHIAHGAMTIAVAGATETPLSPYSLAAFHSVGVLSRWREPTEASRPFERNRSGLVLAEGAAFVVLEEENFARSRGATLYARVLGRASGVEGEHLRKVDPTGAIVKQVMEGALKAAGLAAQDVDYISAHGNSMPDYDLAETVGIKGAFGTQAYRIPISSLKSMCGQALAASGALQVVGACLSLRDNCVAPTINLRERDPQCDLDYVPNEARFVRMRHVMMHAHSMGGVHTALILGQP